MEHFFEFCAHGALTRGVAGALNVGGILKQGKNPVLAVFGEGMQIKELIVSGRGVNFEIAGMNHHAQRSGDGQRHRAHDGVRDVNELNFEGSYFQCLTRLDGVEVSVVGDVVLFEAPFE